MRRNLSRSECRFMDSLQRSSIVYRGLQEDPHRRSLVQSDARGKRLQSSPHFPYHGARQVRREEGKSVRLLRRDVLKPESLPGRVIQKAIGRDGLSPSRKMTMGFAHYSEDSGPMAPHHHAEEIVVVLTAQDGYVRYGGFGEQPDELGGRIPLEAGTILHIPGMEWHVFEYDEGGHVDIIFFYSQADVYSKK